MLSDASNCWPASYLDRGRGSRLLEERVAAGNGAHVLEKGQLKSLFAGRLVGLSRSCSAGGIHGSARGLCWAWGGRGSVVLGRRRGKLEEGHDSCASLIESWGWLGLGCWSCLWARDWLLIWLGEEKKRKDDGNMASLYIFDCQGAQLISGTRSTYDSSTARERYEALTHKNKTQSEVRQLL